LLGVYIVMVSLFGMWLPFMGCLFAGTVRLITFCCIIKDLISHAIK
jgi:hypothetical protein